MTDSDLGVMKSVALIFRAGFVLLALRIKLFATLVSVVLCSWYSIPVIAFGVYGCFAAYHTFNPVIEAIDGLHTEVVSRKGQEAGLRLLTTFDFLVISSIAPGIAAQIYHDLTSTTVFRFITHVTRSWPVTVVLCVLENAAMLFAFLLLAQIIVFNPTVEHLEPYAFLRRITAIFVFIGGALTLSTAIVTARLSLEASHVGTIALWVVVLAYYACVIRAVIRTWASVTALGSADRVEDMTNYLRIVVSFVDSGTFPLNFIVAAALWFDIVLVLAPLLSRVCSKGGRSFA